MNRFFISSISLIYLCIANMVIAQDEHSELEGAQLFRDTCLACHDQTESPMNDVDLTDPVFLNNISNDVLTEIITNGKVGTEMPAVIYSDLLAGKVVTYLREISIQGGISAVDGDPEKGQELVESTGCLECHRINGQGTLLGPDLSLVGLKRNREELEESLVDPSAKSSPENQTLQILIADGHELMKQLLNHGHVTIKLADTKTSLDGGLSQEAIEKFDLKEFRFDINSTMPSYNDLFSTQQRNDILSYLLSLTGEE